MKNDSRDLFAAKERELFHVSDEAMSEEVTDAARILRSFVSHLEPMSDDSHERLYGVTDAAVSSDPFLVDVAPAPAVAEVDPDMDVLLQQADLVSNHLTDAMEFVPRVVEGASGVFSLHPKEDVPIAMKHSPIRLRYKGKASKKQLERLRRRVQMHTQHGG